MNKAELIAAIATQTGASKKATAAFVDAFVGTVNDSIKKGEDVVLTGFGSWKVVERAARDGRNPQTGASIKIPARKVVKFKAGKELASTVK